MINGYVLHDVGYINCLILVYLLLMVILYMNYQCMYIDIMHKYTLVFSVLCTLLFRVCIFCT
nr:MAG TPA: hypothetical protein [Bacteriophage sp.]